MRHIYIYVLDVFTLSIYTILYLDLADLAEYARPLIEKKSMPTDSGYVSRCDRTYIQSAGGAEVTYFSGCMRVWKAPIRSEQMLFSSNRWLTTRSARILSRSKNRFSELEMLLNVSIMLQICTEIKNKRFIS